MTAAQNFQLKWFRWHKGRGDWHLCSQITFSPPPLGLEGVPHYTAACNAGGRYYAVATDVVRDLPYAEVPDARNTCHDCRIISHLVATRTPRTTGSAEALDDYHGA